MKLVTCTNSRQKYKLYLEKKVDTLNNLNNEMLPRDVAFKYSGLKSMITRWKAKQNNIYRKHSESKKPTSIENVDAIISIKLPSVDCKKVL